MIKIKEVPNYSGYYCDKNGNIYSFWTNRGITRTFPRTLKPINHKSGYLFINLKKKSGGYIRTGIHRIICMTFNGLPNINDTASHINGIRNDNRSCNLLWESQKDNLHRKVEHGTSDIGFNNSRAKINESQYNEIIKLLKEKNLTHKKIGEMFNVNRVFITKINNKYRYNIK